LHKSAQSDDDINAMSLSEVLTLSLTQNGEDSAIDELHKSAQSDDDINAMSLPSEVLTLSLTQNDLQSGQQQIPEEVICQIEDDYFEALHEYVEKTK
jgi:hypothetical protein